MITCLKKISLLLLVLMLAAAGGGCASAENTSTETKKETTADDKTILLYYLNASGDGFYTEEYTLENTDDALMASYEVVSRLSDTENNRTDTYKPAISAGVAVNSIVLDGVEETVDMGGGYRQLKDSEEILLRAAVVKSLVQIKGVDSVRFTINGDSLLGSDDNPIGAMNADTFILEEEAGKLFGNDEKVTLYYADMDGDNLVEYKTNLEATDNMPMETRVLLELMKVPDGLDAQSPLPSDLLINQTQIHNGVCYVDLSKDIENVLPGVEEKVMVYAMVNTITSLGNATSVQFTVEGEKMKSLRDFDSFHLMMTNDYSLVESIKN
ncbi:MAG TPA: GerMN domain-containing protein [Candidatus Anaerobutyricum faecale]|nr:GerMN domain-containing protein [Candidatus Anaerobutyricum faecale]